MKLFQLILLGLFLTLNLSAQNNVFCGMNSQELKIQSNKAWQLQKAIRSGALGHKVEDTYLIPIKFHLVADDNGNGRILQHHVLEQLCYLNQAFSDHDIQFFVKDNSFNEIDNSVIFDGPRTQGAEIRMTGQRDDAALNMFLTDKADTQGSLGTTLGYYSPTRDWVVLRIDQFTDGYNSTIGHEVGHFFSLLHPHNGWDDEPWNASDHGNPVNRSSINNVEIECQDRSNCETAGDFLCGTMPDYNFGFGHPDCDYEIQVTDPCGDVVNPDEQLFMGYFLNCSDFSYYFSDDQAEQMIANIESSERDYLQNSFMPGNEPGLANLNSPSNASNLSYNQGIRFDWDDVSGANRYLLQISNRNAFRDANIVHSAFYSTSEALIDELPGNQNYHWRVFPVNEYHTCPNFAEIQQFTFRAGLGTSTLELSEGTSISILNNVIRQGQAIELELKGHGAFDISFQVIDVSGKVRISDVFLFDQGIFNLDQTKFLESGSYFMAVTVGDRVLSTPFIVL